MDNSTEIIDPDGLTLGREDGQLIQVPGSINRHLRPYQREGVQFLYSRYRENAGAILADDMGLGKTIQSIAFISAILRRPAAAADGRATPPFLRTLEPAEGGSVPPVQARRPPVLVICPAAVLYNWLAELTTWSTLDVGLFISNRRTEVVRSAVNRTVDVVLSSFEAARLHVAALDGVEWSAVIVDEAHRLRSPAAQVTRALGGLRCRRRIGLSGTVLQNDLRELWCLLDWANPGCLGPVAEFVREFVRPIERGRRRGAVRRHVAEAWRRRELLATLRQRWLLRRTKTQLLAGQLPNKTDQVVYCAPAELQRRVYAALLERDPMRRLVVRARPCQCGSGRRAARCCMRHEAAPPAAGLALSCISLLLKVANHPCLLLPSGATSSAQHSALAQQACRDVFDEFPELARLSRSQAYRALADPKYCGKMNVLITLLEHFRQKCQKVLIFSYSTRMLKIIRAYVLAQGFDLTYIDGDTPACDRPALCEQFSLRPHWAVALVSTRAGGQGLNIIGATAVIVFDPSWNPAHDLQAQDRAYRLGQTRDVSVFRLITAGTIEENIYLRQVYKQQLSTLAVEGGSGARLFSGSAGRRDQPGELFGLHNLLQLRHDERLTEALVRAHRRVQRLLTAAAGDEASGALPEVRAGVAGLTVADYTAVAPSDNAEVLPSDDADVLPSDDEPEQPAPEHDHGSHWGRAEVTASVDEALRECGVRHVYGNAALVAVSRLEEHVARQAVAAVFRAGATGTQEPAERCAPLPPPPPQAGGSGRRKRTVAPAADVPVLLPSGPHSGRRLPVTLAGPAKRVPERRRRRTTLAAPAEQVAERRRRRRRRRTAPADRAVSREREQQHVPPPPAAADVCPEPEPEQEREPADTGGTCSTSTAPVSASAAEPAGAAGRRSGAAGTDDPAPPAEADVDCDGASTPKRPRAAAEGTCGGRSDAVDACGGRADPVDALLERLLESPVRRPPPSARRQQSQRAADSSDPVSGWVRAGKVSIAR